MSAQREKRKRNRRQVSEKWHRRLFGIKKRRPAAAVKCGRAAGEMGWQS